jgi:hypothetical protein
MYTVLDAEFNCKDSNPSEIYCEQLWTVVHLSVLEVVP